MPSAAVSKTITRLISVDGGSEVEEGRGGLTASLPPFFHIYLNIYIFLCCHLGPISDLSDREALKNRFPNASQGAGRTEGAAKREKRGEGRGWDGTVSLSKIIKFQVSDFQKINIYIKKNE